jgi:hypothetical protein
LLSNKSVSIDVNNLTSPRAAAESTGSITA